MWIRDWKLGWVLTSYGSQFLICSFHRILEKCLGNSFEPDIYWIGMCNWIAEVVGDFKEDRFSGFAFFS